MLADLFPFLAGLNLEASAIGNDEVNPARIVLARICMVGEGARGSWVYAGIGLSGGMKHPIC
ncbi:hypothetical protein Gbfr_007_092 [Gluconobacter frateurii M-2]|nr:hypothetical protein Gbfr_007_092 [Gluconobacter frateurii M-2]